MPSSELKRLQSDLKIWKDERKQLIADYGTRGEKHYMGRMIGGLNPAAQRLGFVRGKIQVLENKIKSIKEQEKNDKKFEMMKAGKTPVKRTPKMKYFDLNTGEASSTKKKNYSTISDKCYPVYKRFSDGRIDYTGWINDGIKHDSYTINVKNPAI